MNLYSPEILEHSREPHGTGVLSDVTHELMQHNPICGDRVQWQLSFISKGLRMRHQSKGCALCKASASVLYEQLNGENIEMMVEAIQQFQKDLEQIIHGEPLPEHRPATLFMGLCTAPSRQSCVWLPWDTLSKLLLQVY